MSNITIADIRTRVQSKIHGASANKVRDFYGLCFEAASNVLLSTDPRETKRYTPITNGLYSQVYDYVAPSDLKGDAIIDLEPQTPRQTSDGISQSYTRRFDQFKGQNSLVVKDNSGVRTLRISKDINPVMLLNNISSTTSNGTWTVGGNATSLLADSYNKVDPTASLGFNISAGGTTAYIENSTMTAVDLTTIATYGSLFVWAYIPDTTAITSVSLRWGSSTANYYSATTTTTQDYTSFSQGWNLLRFDWSSATTTGTPSVSSIRYARITYAYNGTAVTGCRLNDLTAQQGALYNLVYYSDCLFRTSAGVWIQKPTADTDLVNLGTESVNVFLYELSKLVSQEVQGKDGSFDNQFWDDEGKRVYKEYNGRYKSERLRPRQAYYRMVVTNRQRRR